MDVTVQYFFELLTAFIKERNPRKPTNVEWEKIYELSNIHFVSGAIYTVIQKLDNADKPECQLLKKFKSDFFNTNLKYEEQQAAYVEITESLNKEGIKHIFFKGTVIRDYYPVRQLRTLGDMDFLVMERDRQVVDKVLIEKGYKQKVNIGSVWQYRKGMVLLEVHDKIMYSYINERADYVSYFKDSWKNSTSKDHCCTYELNLEYHLLYVITHLAKHFYGVGCGVRMILDVAVMMNKFRDSVDITYLRHELKKLKLDLFAENIFMLCERLFQVKTPENDIHMDEETFEGVCDYILEGGTFGFIGRNEAVQTIRKEYDKISNHKLAQIKAVMGRIFLNRKAMEGMFPYVKKYPYFLPIAWIARGYIRMKNEPKRTKRVLKGLTSGSDKAEESYIIMKKIGLS